MKAIWYCCFVGFFFSSCSWFSQNKKGDPKPITTLPPITQTGANTFGCYVNNELMVAVNKCRGFFCDANPIFDPSIGIVIGGYMDTAYNSPRFLLAFDFKSVRTVGIYSFDTLLLRKESNQELSNVVSVRKYPNLAFSLNSGQDSTYCRGQLNITKWVRGQTGFVSGTFWFDIYNPAKYPDTVRVRDGRFDVGL